MGRSSCMTWGRERRRKDCYGERRRHDLGERLGNAHYGAGACWRGWSTTLSIWPALSVMTRSK